MTDAERKKSIRYTTLIVAVIALSFYLGFILMGVVRA